MHHVYYYVKSERQARLFDLGITLFAVAVGIALGTFVANISFRDLYDAIIP